MHILVVLSSAALLLVGLMLTVSVARVLGVTPALDDGLLCDEAVGGGAVQEEHVRHQLQGMHTHKHTRSAAKHRPQPFHHILRPALPVRLTTGLPAVGQCKQASGFMLLPCKQTARVACKSRKHLKRA